MNLLLLSQLKNNTILYMNFTENFKRFSPFSEGKMQYAGYNYLMMILCVSKFCKLFNLLYVREIMFSMLKR